MSSQRRILLTKHQLAIGVPEDLLHRGLGMGGPYAGSLEIREALGRSRRHRSVQNFQSPHADGEVGFLEGFAARLVLLIGHPEVFDPSSIKRLNEWARSMSKDEGGTLPTLADLVGAFTILKPASFLERKLLLDRKPLLMANVERIAAPASRARQAWIHRGVIQSLDGHPVEAAHFLGLAKAHAHEAYSVVEAAEALSLSVSNLRRRSAIWFGLPPGVVIDLCRIASVANEIRRSEAALKAIAAGHNFPTQSCMGRLFVRFVGVSPRVYRSGPAARPATEIEQELSETG